MAEDKNIVSFTFNVDDTDTTMIHGPVEIKQAFDSLDNVNNDNFENGDIIFINNVLNPENKESRGAYYRFDADNNVWREVLLGTHTHENFDVLNEFVDVATEGKSNDSKVMITLNNGSFELSELPANIALPPIPADIQEKINQYKYRQSLVLNDSEYHHLDASLSDLENNYDFLNNVNTAIGSCQDLFNQLVIRNKKVFFNKANFKEDLFLIDDIKEENKNDIFFEAVEGVISDYDSEIHFKLDTSSNIINIPLISSVTDLDSVFVFYKKYSDANNSELSYSLLNAESDYYIVNKGIKSISIKILNNSLKAINENKLAVVIIKNTKYSDKNLDYLYFIRNHNSFNSLPDLIIDKLVAVKVEFEIESSLSRLDLPHLYLSIDNDGNTYWDRSLVPSQTFFRDTYYITPTNVENTIVKNNNSYYIQFMNVYFNDGKDFPMLLVDNTFAFDITYKINGSSLVFVFTEEQIEKYFNIDIVDFNNINSTVTLLVVKNTGESIAKEIARNYVSKEDAVAILSNGKINLDGYATVSDLLAYSKVGHIHTQYAKALHNHDSRYAMYIHNHPELEMLLAKFLLENNLNDGLTQAELEDWITQKTNEISNSAGDRLTSVINELGFKEINNAYYISDGFVYISDDIKKEINSKIKEINSYHNNEKYLPYLDSNSLYDALYYYSIFFNEDNVFDTQVKLENDLLVTNRLGGLKDKYSAGTQLSTILKDMLYPYVSILEVYNRLRPSENYSSIKWFIKNDNDEFVELNPEKTTFRDTDIVDLWFTLDLKNIYNKECVSESIVFKNETQYIINQYPTTSAYRDSEILKKEEVEGIVYYNFGEKIINDKEEISVDISWSDKVIYKYEDGTILRNQSPVDNYGTEQGVLPTGSISLKSLFTYQYFDIFLHTMSYSDLMNIISTQSVDGYDYGIMNPSEIKFSGFVGDTLNVNGLKNHENTIVVFLEESILGSKLSIRSADNDNITNSFKVLSKESGRQTFMIIDNVKYIIRYYFIGNEEAKSLISISASVLE